MRTFCYFITALSLILITGCNTANKSVSNFYHPYKPHATWDKDYDNCLSSVEALYRSERIAKEDKQMALEDCMSAKDYVLNHAPPPPPNEAGPGNELESQYSLVESTWHVKEMAEERAQYLKSTGIFDAHVKRENSGYDGAWYRVLIGSFDTHSDAQKKRRELKQDNGLHNLVLVRFRL